MAGWVNDGCYQAVSRKLTDLIRCWRLSDRKGFRREFLLASYSRTQRETCWVQDWIDWSSVLIFGRVARVWTLFTSIHEDIWPRRSSKECASCRKVTKFNRKNPSIPNSIIAKAITFSIFPHFLSQSSHI